jgi:hypothetical protein
VADGEAGYNRETLCGYLTEIHFEDGQFVKQGDLLFVIDLRPYEATLAASAGSARPGIQAGEPMTVKEIGSRCASAPASFISQTTLLIR